MASVSVVVPTHNRGDFLRCAIASVLNQTLQDLEVIVVDDASTDNTAEVVEGFGDPRVNYIRHDVNQGVARARNTGILNSRAKYIAFLDDDDEWLPEKLQLQLARLEESPMSVGVVYSSSLAVDGLSRRVLFELTARQRGHIFDAIFVQGSLAPTSTFFCRRECFDRVGLFEPGLEFGEDSDMWLRIAKEFQFEYIEEPLVRFAVPYNKSSLSANYDVMIRGKEAYLRRYATLFSAHSKVHSEFYLNLGALYCYNENPHKGRGAFLKAITLNPLDPRPYFNLCLSCFGTKPFRKFKTLKDRWLS